MTQNHALSLANATSGYFCGFFFATIPKERLRSPRHRCVVNLDVCPSLADRWARSSGHFKCFIQARIHFPVNLMEVSSRLHGELQVRRT